MNKCKQHIFQPKPTIHLLTPPLGLKEIERKAFTSDNKWIVKMSKFNNS